MIHFEEQKVYATSKSTEELFISGDYEVTNNERNLRTKVTSLDNNESFWVDTEDLKQKLDTRDDAHTEEIPVELPTPTIKEIIVEVESPSQPEPIYHIFKRGDTLQSMSNQYGVEYSDIISLNNTSHFAIGQRIRIK